MSKNKIEVGDIVQCTVVNSLLGTPTTRLYIVSSINTDRYIVEYLSKEDRNKSIPKSYVKLIMKRRDYEQALEQNRERKVSWVC